MQDRTLDYLANWFLPAQELFDRAGLSAGAVELLWQARCLPGPIYARQPDGTIWSALAAYLGRVPDQPAAGSEHWYHAGSVWWLRRCALLARTGLDAPQIAAEFQAGFCTDFKSLLPGIEGAALAYPAAFEADGQSLTASVDEIALSEWTAWLAGAYGVCLKQFSARTCIEKEALAKLIAADAEPALPADQSRLLDRMTRLDSLTLPFAPIERTAGTPGRAIDRPLAALKLGRENPYRVGGGHGEVTPC